MTEPQTNDTKPDKAAQVKAEHDEAFKRKLAQQAAQWAKEEALLEAKIAKSEQDYDDFSKFRDAVYKMKGFPLPPSNMPLSDAAFARALKWRVIEKCSATELETNPLFKDAQGHALPVYVVPEDISNRESRGKDVTPQAQLMKTKEGHSYVLINEGFHKWTEPYVTRHFMSSDADIKKYSISSSEVIANLEKENRAVVELYNFKRLVESVQEQSKRMGIYPPPTILVGDYADEHGVGSPASSKTSREGKNYIKLDVYWLSKALLSTEKTDLWKGTIGHELGHIRNGDTTAAGIIKTRVLAVNRYEEALNDLEGAGPLGGHNPRAVAVDFLANLAHTIANRGHPDARDRATALNYEAKRMEAYESAHPDKHPSLAYLKVEEKQVIAEVMAYMKDKWHQPMQEPKPLIKPESAAHKQSSLMQIKDTLKQATQQPVDLPRAPDTNAAASTALYKK